MRSYWVWLGLTRFSSLQLSYDWLWFVLSGLWLVPEGFHWVLICFYLVLLGLFGLWCVFKGSLRIFTWFCSRVIEFDSVLVGFEGDGTGWTDLFFFWQRKSDPFRWRWWCTVTRRRPRTTTCSTSSKWSCWRSPAAVSVSASSVDETVPASTSPTWSVCFLFCLFVFFLRSF